MRPTKIDDSIGMATPYTNRVGTGSFLSELNDATGDASREKGKGYGAMIERPRCCG